MEGNGETSCSTLSLLSLTTHDHSCISTSFTHRDRTSVQCTQIYGQYTHRFSSHRKRIDIQRDRGRERAIERKRAKDRCDCIKVKMRLDWPVAERGSIALLTNLSGLLEFFGDVDTGHFFYCHR